MRYLDPSLIHLYSILPYIGAPSRGVTDFFRGSDFSNFRDAEQLEQSRDPYYADPEGDYFDAEYGPYMRPWVTPLSRLGNHGSVILCDARAHRIRIVDQEWWDSTDEWWDSTDPGIDEETRITAKRKAESMTNQNSFEYFASRPAGDVLRDINRWCRVLKILPGGGENTWLGWSVVLELLSWPSFESDNYRAGQAACKTQRP
jgi:hypothetical protein